MLFLIYPCSFYCSMLYGLQCSGRSNSNASFISYLGQQLMFWKGHRNFFRSENKSKFSVVFGNLKSFNYDSYKLQQKNMESPFLFLARSEICLLSNSSPFLEMRSQNCLYQGVSAAHESLLASSAFPYMAALPHHLIFSSYTDAVMLYLHLFHNTYLVTIFCLNSTKCCHLRLRKY